MLANSDLPTQLLQAYATTLRIVYSSYYITRVLSHMFKARNLEDTFIKTGALLLSFTLTKWNKSAFVYGNKRKEVLHHICSMTQRCCDYYCISPKVYILSSSSPPSIKRWSRNSYIFDATLHQQRKFDCFLNYLSKRALLFFKEGNHDVGFEYLMVRGT